MTFRRSRGWALIASALLIGPMTGCAGPEPGSRLPVPYVAPSTGGESGTRRINGSIGAANREPPAELSIGSGYTLPTPSPVSLPPQVASAGPVSLDFADTDIREIAARILGSIFRLNYTIDPAVKGTGTFHSERPLSPTQVMAVLQTLLAQNGAALVRSGSLYRVVPAAAAVGLAQSPDLAGSLVVPLHYVQADNLAKVLQPVVGPAVRVFADPAQNALLISGEPEARNAVVDLARSFDSDTLAGQSFALFPLPQGANPKDYAEAMQSALSRRPTGGLAGTELVRVLPLPQTDAVLVVASQPRYLEAARRVFGLLQREQRATLRTWHVYYLQSSRAEDTAYLLQRAFTPNDVTAQPTAQMQPQEAGAFGTQGGIGGMGGMGGTGYNGIASGGLAGGGLGLGGGAAGGLALGGAPTAGIQPGTAAGAPRATAPAGNPLLGGLEAGTNQPANAMRIIPDPANNSVLIFATADEEGTVEAMIRKIDIVPLQVRIDAIIAEVTLNDALQYGTQFFFKEGDLNQLLSTANDGSITGAFPGFVFSSTAQVAKLAISALQSVTQVRVLSSPELMVLNDQSAALQVGNLVPYLTTSSQSTLVSGSPIINSINYRQTGVILKITPRVNSGGLVTLDVSQEVSAVAAPTPATSGINSPTFSDRLVESRVVIHDGQTIGLAGLITDNAQTGNQGIPFLRNVPLLGLLSGTQNNQRNRTELLVLITPHVVHDARQATALTQDLLTQLPGAATQPAYAAQPMNRYADPNAKLLSRIPLAP